MVTPIPMPSNDDVGTLIDLLNNAVTNNIPIDDVYAGMISPLGSYQIRFTGNINDIINNTLDLSSVSIENSYMAIMRLNKADRELGFLKFLRDKVGIAGIELYKIDTNGSIIKKELNGIPGNESVSNVPCT
ncbi:MAG: hypothetical protein HC854_04530 [Flavobacterium sp.]|nr:hypothetical protein [Flavobacterium sp.]